MNTLSFERYHRNSHVKCLGMHNNATCRLALESKGQKWPSLTGSSCASIWRCVQSHINKTSQIRKHAAHCKKPSTWIQNHQLGSRLYMWRWLPVCGCKPVLEFMMTHDWKVLSIQMCSWRTHATTGIFRTSVFVDSTNPCWALCKSRREAWIPCLNHQEISWKQFWLQTAFATAIIEPRGTAKAARILSCTLGHANASEGTSRSACNNLEFQKLQSIQGLGLHKQARVWNLGHQRSLHQFHWRVHFPSQDMPHAGACSTV